jgi:GNAT superfamily N-acetyltransferase
VHDDDLDMLAELFEPARSLAALDGDAIVATTGIDTRELTVPGAVLRVAGVSLVGVLPTHRRRGLLNALMRRPQRHGDPAHRGARLAPASRRRAAAWSCSSPTTRSPG